jgi:SAM-dependent methyltransferase
LRKSILRFLSYRLDTLSGNSRVLDLGCGSGYFQLVCEHFGHKAVGLDLDDDPFFNDVIEYLGLERVIHVIKPFQPLPRIEGGPFDAVTAFMTCFNRYSDGAPWQTDEWSYFIDDLATQMRPGGKLIVKFNRNHKLGRPFPTSLPRELPPRSKRDIVFFADTMIVTY